MNQSSKPTRRVEVIDLLRSRELEIRALGAQSLYLYGSYARDETGETSDVDLFIDRDPARKFGLLELAGLHLLLEDILETEVDVGTRTSLHPVLRAGIERSSVRVF